MFWNVCTSPNCKIRSQTQTILALYNQDILRGGRKRDYHRLRMCVKLHTEQAQRGKNFRIQNEITQRGGVNKGKGQNPFTKRKTGECFQFKANGSCSRGGSCSFLHMPASGNREIERKKVENARGSSLKPAGRAKCKRSSCNYRHPPVCRNYQSGNRCTHCSNCLYRDADGEEKPSKKSKKESTPGAVAVLRDKKGPMLCISKFRSKEVYSEESWANEIERFGETHHKILRTHLVRNSNSGKKRAIWRNYPKR